MKRERLYFGALLPMLLAAIYGCMPAGPELAPLPVIPLDRMDDSVREQFGSALAALEADETNPELNGRLGMLLDAYALPAEAVIVYARARRLAPTQFKWAYLHGLTLAKLGHDEPAIDALQLALKLRPDYPIVQFELARLLGNIGETDAAVSLFQQLLEHYPGIAQVHYAYGKLLYEQGEIAAAVTSLESAVRIYHRYGKAHHVLSQAYRDLGQDEKVILHAGLFKRYLRHVPPMNDPVRAEVQSLNTRESYLGQRALMMAERGKNREAADLLEDIAREYPDRVSVRTNLVGIYAQLEDYDKAQEHADIGLTIEPDSRDLLHNIGVMRRGQGQYDEAAEFFLQALQIEPYDAVLHVRLGTVREAVGRLDEAIASYRRAVELDPGNRQASHYLARVLADNDIPVEASP